MELHPAAVSHASGNVGQKSAFDGPAFSPDDIFCLPIEEQILNFLQEKEVDLLGMR